MVINLYFNYFIAHLRIRLMLFLSVDGYNTTIEKNITELT